jgi:hypothetical protein
MLFLEANIFIYFEQQMPVDGLFLFYSRAANHV